MILQHDVLVIGAGLAGQRAALEIAKNKIDVAIISKVYPVRSHSCAAQGGINAVLSPDDSIDSHEYDTVKGSDYLGDQDAIKVFAKEAPECVVELENMGVPFNRTDAGKIAGRPFGGASYPRACFIADITGQSILHVLYEQILKYKVKVYEECWVSSLIVEDGVCKGVISINLNNLEFNTILAKHVVLATGGLGQVFYPTSNALVCTGDGMYLAYKAGAPLMDMEMVQFHPTTLKSSGILLTEGCRGEGGYLLNNKGERFMSNSAPNKMELASRDVVSRAEHIEILEGRGVDGCVLLDLRHLGRDRIIKKLGQVRDLAKVFVGIDPIDNPIPVRPGMHYAMGGVKCDVNGQTYIKNLYAAGETACVTIHGANRLGGNSLMEAVVFGRRTGKHLVELLSQPSDSVKLLYDNFQYDDQNRVNEILNRPDTGVYAHGLHRELGELMVRSFGVFRNKEQMQKGIDGIKAIKSKLKDLCVLDKSKVFNHNIIFTLELEGMVSLAEAIGHAAFHRTESRGAHCRTDYTKRDDKNWMHHILCYKTDGQPRFDKLEVTSGKWAPEVRSY